MTSRIAIIETHPVQYHAPVYRMVQQKFGIPVTAIYGSDFSVKGYRDKEFMATLAWDTDLLSGYDSIFLSRSSNGRENLSERISARGLQRVLKEVNPNAVLLTGYSPLFYSIALFQVWRSGLPILFRAETIDSKQNIGSLKKGIRNFGLSWVYQQCRKLLYIGRRSYEHFKHLGLPDEKLSFSPYCVDTTPFCLREEDRNRLRSTVRDELQIKVHDRVLLFSGKLSFRKGVDLLFKTVRSLPLEIQNSLTLIFMGDGEFRNQLEKAAKDAHPVKSHFVGFQNQTKLSPYYHAADLLVLPSRRDPWGLVVNEAMHHGLPCVVSEAVGCAPDLVEPGVTGEIFETDSPRSLASAIERAIKLIDRPENRERCRKKVEGYTVEKAAEGVAKAYWEAMKKN